jgi:NAD(P)-dependent dehydrogenase (short-subunit alcohol dehydrogenase family)
MSLIFASDLLLGKKMLITGASSGIGKATSIALAGCGAELVITGRNESRLIETAEEVAPKKCVVAPMVLDNFEGILAWAENISKQHGPFDGVFHSAGEALLIPMRLIKKKDYEQVFNPSLMSAIALSAALSKRGCMQDGGAIVFMSSVAGSTGRQGMSLYSASKSGIDGLARSLAVELAPRGIRVNSLAAGAVRTELHNQIVQNSRSSTLNDYESLHPLGFGDASDITNMVVYLLSEAGRWITGTVLAVDGGYTAK